MPAANYRFAVGDVVCDALFTERLGIVMEASDRSVTVAFANGSIAGGPGLLSDVSHREPRVTAAVPPVVYVHGSGWWNRSQAVKAAIRRATK